MKWIILVSLLLIPTTLFAESYTLTAESHCSSSGEQLDFSCKAGASFSGAQLSILKNEGSWFGRETLKTLDGSKKNQFRMSLTKNNASVMVFDYPVKYSGIATIVLIKKTCRYYFSEISYSETLDVQNVTIEDGRFTVSE